MLYEVITGMMSKSQTGTVADLDSLASLELKRQRRRKLLFLTGIVVITLVGGFLLYHFYAARTQRQVGPGPSAPPRKPEAGQMGGGPDERSLEAGGHPNRLV